MCNVMSHGASLHTELYFNPEIGLLGRSETVTCKAFGPDILKISEILRIIAKISEQNVCDFQKLSKSQVNMNITIF